jgi:hypothetical protein
MTNKFYGIGKNVWLAQTLEDYNKGDIIIMTNRHGKEKEYKIHNLYSSKERSRSGHNYYSITPIEDKNYYERKAERMEQAIKNSLKKSDEYYEKSNKGSDFLCLGEPIKIGHHSEKRHRKLIESNHKAMGKCIEFKDKAQEQIYKLEYYESMKDHIDLSMPDSLEFYQNSLETLEQKHKFLKDNPKERSHAFSLAYAKKEVKECKERIELAIKLWGN